MQKPFLWIESPRSLYKPDIWQMLSCKTNYYDQNVLHNCETHFVMHKCLKSYCIAFFSLTWSEESATHIETRGFNKRLILWQEKCFSFLLCSCLNVKHVVRWLPLEIIWLKLKVKTRISKREWKCCSDLDNILHTLTTFILVRRSCSSMCSLWTEQTVSVIPPHAPHVHSSSLPQNPLLQAGISTCWRNYC